jgi:hypothetical protein
MRSFSFLIAASRHDFFNTPPTMVLADQTLYFFLRLDIFLAWYAALVFGRRIRTGFR